MELELTCVLLVVNRVKKLKEKSEGENLSHHIDNVYKKRTETLSMLLKDNNPSVLIFVI